MHAGEAQKIDRIMERFAERYCKDNPDVFQTSDGAYLLSFALIMLNTDAHNPMADKKLSLEDFISMCQFQVHLLYSQFWSQICTNSWLPPSSAWRKSSACIKIGSITVAQWSCEMMRWFYALCREDHPGNAYKSQDLCT